MVRNTATTRQVLNAFVESGGTRLYGFDLIRVTGLPSGTVYPILQRLEGEGWLSSAWEQIDPTELGRPRRRFYRISAGGVAAAGRFNDEIAARRRRASTPWQAQLPQKGAM